MNTKDAVALATWLVDLPQFKHHRRDEATYRRFAEELADLNVTVDQAQDACRSLLAVDDQRFPTPQAIRRRFAEEAGMLAPPTAEAMLLIREAATDPGYDIASLPESVLQAVRTNGGFAAISTSDNPTATFAQVRDTYEALAARHNRAVLEPGGIARYQELADVAAARRQQLEVRRMAITAASELFLDEYPDTPAQCQRVVDQYVARFGELPAPYQPPDPMRPRPGLPAGAVDRDGPRRVREVLARIGRAV